MTKFVIVSLCALALCESGSIPSDSVHRHFPHLKTIDHGHGATSYQNVNVQNFGSVPIPKDLQVDDGHEYENAHRLEYLDQLDDKNIAEIFFPDIQNYVDDEEDIEHVIVPSEVPEELNYHVVHRQPLENYAPSSPYEYERKIDYEYR